MGKLLANDGDGDADSGQYGLGESGADGQTVDEVVQTVSEDDHPSDGGDVRSPARGDGEIVRVAVVTVILVVVKDAIGFGFNDHVVVQIRLVGRGLK